MALNLKYLDLLKLRLSKLLVVNEILTDFFFSGPNNYSNYDFCIRYGRNNHKINKLSPFSRFSKGIVDHQRKTLIFYSPKCGSSSIRAFSQKELKLGSTKKGLNNASHVGNVPFIIDNEGRGDKTYAKKIVYWSTYKDYQKYLVVRDPYERVVSYFKHMLINNQGKHVGTNKLETKHITLTLGLIIKDFEVLDIGAISFDFFVRRLYERYKKASKLTDEHLARQVSIDFKVIALKDTTLVPLQKLEELFGALRKEYNLPEPEKKVHLNESDHLRLETKTTPLAYKMPLNELVNLPYSISSKSFFNVELEKMIREMYADDYEAWELALKSKF